MVGNDENGVRVTAVQRRSRVGRAQAAWFYSYCCVLTLLVGASKHRTIVGFAIIVFFLSLNTGPPSVMPFFGMRFLRKMDPPFAVEG